MEKVLNQSEIDAMVRAARGGGAEGSASPTVTPWDIRAAGQIGREQMSAINILHEGFARNLTHAVGAYLRIVFDTTLVSAEHLTFREFLQRLPESTYIASSRVAPLGVTALLQLDLAVAFPIIDLLLGGEGRGGALPRDVTEIEEQILESVIRIVLRELQTTWQALTVEFNFEQRQPAAQAQRLMPPEEKNLCLSFEITMPETRGTLNLAVPAVVSNALLRKISAEWSYQKPRVLPESTARLKKVLLQCPFPLELVVPECLVPMGTLATLAPGNVLALPQPADASAILLTAGQALFRGSLVRVGDRRAVRIKSRIHGVAGEKEPT